MGNICGGSSRRRPGSAYEMMDRSGVQTKLTRLDRERVHRPELRCSECALNVDDRPDAEENTLSPDELRTLLEECKRYHAWLHEHRGDIQPRGPFYTFIQSGRLWILHAVHAMKCDDPDNLDVALDGLQDWFSALISVYETNIYNPHSVSRVNVRSHATGTVLLRPNRQAATRKAPQSDAGAIREDEIRLQMLEQCVPSCVDVEKEKSATT